MPTPSFTFDWISSSWPTWEKHLPPANQSIIAVLEVGCFEGRTTCYFLERYPNAHLHCIDTFEGGLDHKQLGIDFSSTEQRFYNNMRTIKARSSLRVYKGQSYTQLRNLHSEYLGHFDIALIDGSHLAPDVLSDIVLTWPLLAPGALLILDDYGWGRDRPMIQTPKPAIDAFLACYFGQYELLESGYQVLVRKL